MVKNDFCALGLLQKCGVGSDGLKVKRLLKVKG